MWMLAFSVVGLILLGCVAALRWTWVHYGSLFEQGWHNIGVDHTCGRCQGTGYRPTEAAGTLTRCGGCIDGKLPADPDRFTAIPLAFPWRRKWN